MVYRQLLNEHYKAIFAKLCPERSRAARATTKLRWT